MLEHASSPSGHQRLTKWITYTPNKAPKNTWSQNLPRKAPTPGTAGGTGDPLTAGDGVVSLAATC